MIRATFAAVLAGATLAVMPAATAVQLEPADRDVSRVRVTYVELVLRPPAYRPSGKWFVELNNGAAYKLRPCRAEDSEHCYWDARVRGNRKGKSFVRIEERTVYMPARVLRRIVK